MCIYVGTLQMFKVVCGLQVGKAVVVKSERRDNRRNIKPGKSQNVFQNRYASRPI